MEYKCLAAYSKNVRSVLLPGVYVVIFTNLQMFMRWADSFSNTRFVGRTYPEYLLRTRLSIVTLKIVLYNNGDMEFFQDAGEEL